MSASQKVAVAVVVLLGLAFVTAVVVQSSGGDRGGGRSEDSAHVFRGLAGDPASVDRADLRAACLVGDRLVFTGECTLTVAAGRESMRLVRLLPSERVDVEAPAPRTDDLTIEAELQPGKEVAIAVDETGGEIQLDCQATGDCSVQWVSGAGK